MDSKTYREVGVRLAHLLFDAVESLFVREDFMNALQVKRWLGRCIKENCIDLYENLEWKDYKVICDLKVHQQTYHVGIDFGQQAIHVTVGPGDVYSIYYRTTLESE